MNMRQPTIRARITDVSDPDKKEALAGVIAPHRAGAMKLVGEQLVQLALTDGIRPSSILIEIKEV